MPKIVRLTESDLTRLIDKYLKYTNYEKELLETYMKLRELFQSYGWSEKDLEKPPRYTRELMSLFHEFEDRRSTLFNDLRSYFDITWEEFLQRMIPKLQKINELTPLADGNKERDDSGDEDY